MRRAAVILAFVWAASAYAATIKMYLFAGQSNMAGKGYNLCQCQYTFGTNTNVYFYGNITNAFLAAPDEGSSGYAFGPEISAAPILVLKDTGKVSIVKYALGSSWITSNWTGNANAWAGFSNRVRLAQVGLTNAGFQTQFGGMAWYQGESESQSPSAASNYYANLTNFIAQCRNSFDTNLAFVVVQIAPSTDWTYFSTITNAQASVATGMPRVASFAPRVIGMYDSQHPDSYSLLAFGEQIGAAFLSNFP